MGEAKMILISAFCVIFINVFLAPKTDGHLLIDQIRWQFLNLEEKFWPYVLEEYRKEFNGTEDAGAEIVWAFNNFDKNVQQMPQDLLYGMDVVRQTPSFFLLFSDLRVVSDLYEKFRTFLSAKYSTDISELYERETKKSFIIDEVLRDPKNKMNKTVTNMLRQIFDENDDGNILSSLFDTLLETDYVCKKNKESPQQVLYNLYNAVALAELKAYIMVQFSYLASRIEEKGNYTHDSIAARKRFEQRTNLTALTIQRIMKIMPSKLWKCDPKYYTQGETYESLTALLQGHIENEVDMNNGGTCKKNCAAYSYSQSYGCYDGNSDYCAKRKPCTGRILNCRFMESHMTACLSPSYSSRRYEYIQYKSGKLLGEKYRCQSRNINSWFRWFVHCSYCLCLCDQEGPKSDRYFNLRPVLADVNKNRVVTGLRIIKQNRLIHLQIQEGKLLPYGYIDQSTVRWVPVDDYKITDWNVRQGEDFHTMNYEHRTMFLDDLTPHETDHIVTGVRFEYVDNHLKFGINVRSFNFETGDLSSDSYYVFGGDKRKKIDIYDPDVPTDSPSSKPNFEDDTYVEFTHTSFDKDAAQTTVPFFDTQPVAAQPALPLKGAGIYYKGNWGYGGFIAPKIKTYDFTRHMVVKFPKIEPRMDMENEFPIIA